MLTLPSAVELPAEWQPAEAQVWLLLAGDPLLPDGAPPELAFKNAMARQLNPNTEKTELYFIVYDFVNKRFAIVKGLPFCLTNLKSLLHTTNKTAINPNKVSNI